MLNKKKLLNSSTVLLIFLILLGWFLAIYISSPTEKIISENQGISSLTFILNTDKKSYTVSACDNPVAVIDIPSMFDNGINGEWPVTIIGANAFSAKNKITKIIIPNTITTINSRAFYNSISLVKIDFKNDSVLTSIGTEVFRGCTSLTSIQLPNSITSIGYGWYIDSDYNFKFNFNTIIKQNYTLYAKFKIEVLSEHLNNPTLIVGSEFKTLSTLRNANKNIRTGYTLIDWNYIKEDSLEIITEETIFNYDNLIIIDAVFIANVYTINFDVIYEDGQQISSKQIAYDSVYANLPAPERSGFEFLGWYYNGTKVNNEDIFIIPSDITLSAQWKLIPFDFTIIYIIAGLIIAIIIIIITISFRRRKAVKNLSLGHNKTNTSYYDILNKKK